MRVLTIVLALIAVVATWLVFGPRPDKPPAAPPAGYLRAKGDAFFASSFKQFGSAVLPLRPFEGKPVIVYFWATWCVECRDESRALLALQAKYRGSGLAVVGIGVDQADKIERFARENQIDYPVFVGGGEGIELARKMGNLRGDIPFIAAIDRRGQVTSVHVGKSRAATLEALATDALK